ncbi:MAG: aldehyde ferredoxin oxidoreductase C-terminal domain-containing protein [Oscillochloridaceae bacterium]|nr:aldehyde:ferredoxin oxidoreductase [Chloroflexaceae bacterium]MDW8389391.1 aldehyde ferredoxin oxidoreductase C-terminal domain-containing protein [Oscillochloridaceae bacterium]
MALRTLTIDLERGHARQHLPATVERDYMGGRGAIAWLLWNHLPPDTPPLAPENLLIFAAGPLAGLSAFANGGFVVGARSPLTGSIGYSWAAGHWGAALRRAGCDVLVVRGQAPEWVYLYIDGTSVRLRPATQLMGLDTAATDAALRAALGNDVRVLCLGPAGENGVAYSSIVAEGRYMAEPAGTAVVMANKRLKAIVVRPGADPLPAQDARRLAAALEIIRRRVEGSSVAAGIRMSGDLHLLERARTLGALSRHNGRDGATGWSIPELLGERRSRGCAGCPMPCYFDLETSESRAPMPDLETVAGFGARCGIDDGRALTAIAERCLRLGLDPVSTSAAVAFLMECQAEGLSLSTALPWGDAAAVLEALERLATPQERRDLLSLGVGEIAEVFWGGAAFAPQSKGLAMSALDPRALTGFALAMATAPIGGDARYSMPYADLVEDPPAWLPEAPPTPSSVQNQALRLIWHERFAAALDAAGLCRRLGLLAYQVSPGELLAMINAATGTAISAADMTRLGERIVTVERLFARRYADNGGRDDLPARWRKQPLGEGPAAGQTPPLADLLAEYYRRHGWNADGDPTPERLAELGIRHG